METDHFQSFNDSGITSARIAVDVDHSIGKRFMVPVCSAKRSFPRLALSWVKAKQARRCLQPDDAVVRDEDALKYAVKTMVPDGVSGEGEVSHASA